MMQAFQFEAAEVFHGVLDLDYTLTNPAASWRLIPFIISGQLIDGVSRAAHYHPATAASMLTKQFAVGLADYARCVAN